MHEDVVANNFNALVAYQALEYRGEPLSSFEREALHHMDTLSADQRTYFEMTQARFQHLDIKLKVFKNNLQSSIIGTSDFSSMCFNLISGLSLIFSHCFLSWTVMCLDTLFGFCLFFSYYVNQSYLMKTNGGEEKLM